MMLDRPAKSAAPVASVVLRNVRRVTPGSSFEFEDFSCMSVERTFTNIAVNVRREVSPSAESG